MKYGLETLKNTFGFPENLELIILQTKSNKIIEALKDNENVYVAYNDDLWTYAREGWNKFKNVAPSGKIVKNEVQFEGTDKVTVLLNLGLTYEQAKNMKGKIAIDIKKK